MISSLFVLVFYYPRVKLGLDHEVLVICVQGLPYLGKERILVGHVAVTPLSAHAVLAPVTGEEYCIGSSLKFVSAGASPAQLLVKLPLFHRLGEALTAAESCCLSHIFNVKLLNGLILVEAKLNLVVLLRDYAALVVGLPVLGDIPRYTPYLEMKLGAVVEIPYAPPGSQELFSLMRERVGTERGYLLCNHGPIVAGRSLMNAFECLEELEQSSWLAWEAYSTGVQLRNL